MKVQYEIELKNEIAEAYKMVLCLMSLNPSADDLKLANDWFVYGREIERILTAVQAMSYAQFHQVVYQNTQPQNQPVQLALL